MTRSKARKPEPFSTSARTMLPPLNMPKEKRSMSSAIRAASPFISRQLLAGHRRGQFPSRTRNRRAKRRARHRLSGKIEWIEGNAFDLLKDYSSADRHYDTIVLDPPAFAKSKRDLDAAFRGYKELNLRALKMLRPGGVLVTCSCSYHVSQSNFLEMLAGCRPGCSSDPASDRSSRTGQGPPGSVEYPGNSLFKVRDCPCKLMKIN